MTRTHLRAEPCSTCGRSVTVAVTEWDGLAAGRLTNRADGRVTREYHSDRPGTGDLIDGDCNYEALYG